MLRRLSLFDGRLLRLRWLLDRRGLVVMMVMMVLVRILRLVMVMGMSGSRRERRRRRRRRQLRRRRLIRRRSLRLVMMCRRRRVCVLELLRQSARMRTLTRVVHIIAADSIVVRQRDSHPWVPPEPSTLDGLHAVSGHDRRLSRPPLRLSLPALTRSWYLL